MCLIILHVHPSHCSRLLESGEDAKVKGTRKVGGARKRGGKKEEGRNRAFSIQRTRLSRSLEQAMNIQSSDVFASQTHQESWPKPFRIPSTDSKFGISQ